MIVKINKSHARGSVLAPPSKSMAHRLLICASLCDGKSLIKRISDCEDVIATLDCLKAFGVKASFEADDLSIEGRKLFDATPIKVLDAKESASTLRFLIPIALATGKTVMFTGSPSLMQRPMGVYQTICKEKSLDYLIDGQTITVKGPLKSGDFSLVGNVSSQFISGLLFVLPLLKGDSRIKITPPIESRSYIEMTRLAQSYFGVESTWEDEHTLFIKGGQKYNSCEVSVEGDYSGAVFTDALNLFGGEVKVEGLNAKSIQGDSIYSKYFEMLNKGVPTIHVGNCPDLAPILFAIASAKNGGVFSGTRRLKIKESDRAQAMAEELKKFGVSVTVCEDKVVVYPINFKAPVEPINCHNDHRIAMALSILLTITGGELRGAEVVSKSYPAFFEHLKVLGVDLSISL